MKDLTHNADPVLVAGNGSMASSVAYCLSEAGHAVEYYCNNLNDASDGFSDLCDNTSASRLIVENIRMRLITAFSYKVEARLAIALPSENIEEKKGMISWLENVLDASAVIAVANDSFDLADLQKNALHPERICGLNWSDPAHTTRFLEVIVNKQVKKEIADYLLAVADAWQKDPYVVQEFGTRNRLISAMAREAFFLVTYGYATVEDIDRACRNDPGYYLPFSGNCRYMDLMGTRAYGMVMKDLNPDLCTDTRPPRFFSDLVEQGRLGMKNGRGIYDYTPEEVDDWKKAAGKFSREIRTIIDKYPFNYKTEETGSPE